MQTIKTLLLTGPAKASSLTALDQTKGDLLQFDEEQRG
jgi:hypothetical protein